MSVCLNLGVFLKIVLLYLTVRLSSAACIAWSGVNFSVMLIYAVMPSALIDIVEAGIFRKIKKLHYKIMVGHISIIVSVYGDM